MENDIKDRVDAHREADNPSMPQPVRHETVPETAHVGKIGEGALGAAVKQGFDELHQALGTYQQDFSQNYEPPVRPAPTKSKEKDQGLER